MWSLIHQNHGSYFGRAGYNLIFPPELQIAIFWEETKFQNIRQVNGQGQEVGPAVGFGQVEPNGIRQVNQKFQTTFNVDGSDVRRNELQSVQLSSLMLAKLWEDQVQAVAKGRQLSNIGMMRHAALFNYAGAATRPQNALLPDKWLNCMRALQTLKLAAPPLQLNAGQVPAIKKALALAKAGDWQGEDQNIFP
jgi:hypothetical protein